MLDLDRTSELVIRHLKAVSNEMGSFVAGLLSDDLTRDDQIAFAHKLVDLAETIRERAVGQPGMVIEGSLVERATPASPPRPRAWHD